MKNPPGFSLLLTPLLAFLPQDPSPAALLGGFSSPKPSIRKQTAWKVVRRGEVMIPALLDFLEKDWNPPLPVWMPREETQDVVGIGGGGQWSRTKPSFGFWDKMIQSFFVRSDPRFLESIIPVPAKNLDYVSFWRDLEQFPESPFDLASWTRNYRKKLPPDPRVPAAWCLGWMPRITARQAQRMLQAFERNSGNALGDQIFWALDRHKKVVRKIILETWKQRVLTQGERRLLLRNGRTIEKELLLWRRGWKTVPINRLSIWILLWDRIGVPLPLEFLNDLRPALSKDFKGKWIRALSHCVRNGREGISLVLAHLGQMPPRRRKWFYQMIAAKGWSRSDLLIPLLRDLHAKNQQELRASAFLALLHIRIHRATKKTREISLRALREFLTTPPTKEERSFALIRLSQQPPLIPFFTEILRSQVQGEDPRLQAIALAAFIRSPKAPENNLWPLLKPLLYQGDLRKKLALGLISRLRPRGSLAKEIWLTLNDPKVKRRMHLSKNAVPWIWALTGLRKADPPVRKEVQRILLRFLNGPSKSRRIAANAALKALPMISSQADPFPLKQRRKWDKRIATLKEEPDPKLMTVALREAIRLPNIPFFHPPGGIHTSRSHHPDRFVLFSHRSEQRFDPDLIPILEDPQLKDAHPILALLYLVGSTPKAYSSLCEDLIPYFHSNYLSVHQQAGWALLQMGSEGAKALATHLSSTKTQLLQGDIDLLRCMRKTGLFALTQALKKDPTLSKFLAFAQVGGLAPDKAAPILLQCFLDAPWTRDLPLALEACGQSLRAPLEQYLEKAKHPLETRELGHLLHLADQLELCSSPIAKMALEGLAQNTEKTQDPALHILLLAKEKGCLPVGAKKAVAKFFQRKFKNLDWKLLEQLAQWPDFFRNSFPKISSWVLNKGPQAATTLFQTLLQHPDLAPIGIPLAQEFSRGPWARRIPEALLLLHRHLQPPIDSARIITNQVKKDPKSLLQWSWLQVLWRFNFSSKNKKVIQRGLLSAFEEVCDPAKTKLDPTTLEETLSGFFTYLDRERPLPKLTLDWLRVQAKRGNPGASWVLRRTKE